MHGRTHGQIAQRFIGLLSGTCSIDIPSAGNAAADEGAIPSLDSEVGGGPRHFTAFFFKSKTK